MGRERRIFVAGSTGATGRTVMRLAAARGADVIGHQRRKAERPADPRARVVDLADKDALVEELRGCTTVLQLIGTMRKRFAAGDTYETSDIGTTRQIADAAAAAGIDHFVLLSSVGAGRPMGAYLAAKARAEALVVESGVPYTIFRPSTFVGEGHRAPPGFALVTRVLGLSRLRPIPIEDLGRALLHAALERAPLGTVLEGEALWAVVEAAKSR